jgi:hypothetical protein
MALNENEQTVLDLICSRGGGVSIQYALEQSGMDYKTFMDTVQQLIWKGYKLAGYRVGHWIQRVYLSPYDKNYETLIKK